MKIPKLFLFICFISFFARSIYSSNIFPFQLIIDRANQALKSNNQSADEPVLVMIEIAGDNNLYPFAGRNIKQMQMVGTNNNVTILIDFHMHRPGQPKASKRFIIEKNKLTQIGPDECMDSGDINTLISFLKWGIEGWPNIKRRILFIWNHATGILEPYIKQAFNPSELFRYNPSTKLIELDRKVGFMDFINKSHSKHECRGICFDDTTGNYLTTQKLKEGLHKVKHEIMGGNKFDVIVFDACLMSMIEIASVLKDYSHVMASSSEVVLGTGLNYHLVLSPFINSRPNNITFAKHIVSSYNETYSKITNDFTYSAIDLQHIHLLEENVQKASRLLIYGLKNQKNKTVKEAIKLSRHKNFCTHFDEPTYIDFGHFWKNLLNNISKFELKNTDENAGFKHELSSILQNGLDILNKVVIANTAGKNLQNATGLSIYNPDYKMHSSYAHCEFAAKTGYLEFINTYLNS